MIQKWQFIRQIPGKVASFGFYQYIWGVSESFTIKIYVYICIHMGCWRKLSSWYPSGVRIRKLWGKRRGDSAHGSFPNQPLRTTQLCVLRLQMLMCAAKNHWWLRSWWESVLEVAWEIVWNEVCVCRAEYLPQFLRNKNQRQVSNLKFEMVAVVIQFFLLLQDSHIIVKLVKGSELVIRQPPRGGKSWCDTFLVKTLIVIWT